MNQSDAQQRAVAAPKRDLALWVSSGLWLLWVTVPSLLVNPLASGSGLAPQFIASEVGPSAAPYLNAAPQPLLTYLLAGYLLALPTLIALAAQIRPASAALDRVKAVLRRLGAFALIYVLAAAIVALVMLVRGAPGALVWGWTPRFTIYGLLTTLPQVGWVFAVAILVSRFWSSLSLTLLGAFVCATGSRVLAVKQVHFPTPTSLRAELLSGRSEAVAGAAIGLLLWGVIPVLIALTLRERRSWSRSLRFLRASVTERN